MAHTFPRRIAAYGLVSTIVVTVASSARGWPFPSLTAEPWFYQLNTTNTVLKYSMFVLFFAGVAGLCYSWLQLLKFAKAPGVTWRPVAWVATLWSLPLLIAVPLYSGDVYVYWVDGQALARGFDPYQTGVSSMGADGDVLMVHSLWRATQTMYGPVFIRIAQGIAELSGDSVIAGVLMLRALAVASVVMTGAAVVAIARRLHHSPAFALAFAVANPIVLLHLVSGAHNDAMMLGLLTAGIALGVTSKNKALMGLGLVLCVLGAMFKVPAIAGAFVLGWIWAGTNASIWRRIICTAIAGVAAAIVFQLMTMLTGLGWGWVEAADVPGLAHPLLAPANAVAASFGALVGDVDGVNAITRAIATLASLALAVALILRSGNTASPERVLRAFGWGLLAIAWLGPAVYPWYLVWGIAIVAAVGAGRLDRHLTVVIVAVCFVVAPGGYGMLDLVGGFWRTLIAFVVTGVFAWGAYKAVKAVYPDVELRRPFKRNGANKWESSEQSLSA